MTIDDSKDPNRQLPNGQWTHYPFADPKTRHEARENAKWHAIQGHYDASLAWSAIAEVFPEDTVLVVDSLSGMQREIEQRVLAGAGNTTTLEPTGDPSSPVTVDPAVYDVLRVLAVRYMLASLDRKVSVDLSDVGELETWEVKFTKAPESPVVQCFLERPAG